jgi:hypothetical protein
MRFCWLGNSGVFFINSLGWGTVKNTETPFKCKFSKIEGSSRKLECRENWSSLKRRERFFWNWLESSRYPKKIPHLTGGHFNTPNSSPKKNPASYSTHFSTFIQAKQCFRIIQRTRRNQQFFFMFLRKNEMKQNEAAIRIRKIRMKLTNKMKYNKKWIYNEYSFLTFLLFLFSLFVLKVLRT